MRERLTHNLGLKILSLFLAALVWILIMNIADPIVTENITGIPVHVINEDVLTSRGYGYSIESGDRVNLRVRGKKSIVKDLTVEDFKATADFLSLNDMYLVPITVTCSADKADEIEISLRTESLAIKREEQTTVIFDVDTRVIGETAEGYRLIKCVPDTLQAEVTGSLSQIGEVAKLMITPDVSERTTSFTEKYTVAAYDAYGNRIDSRRLAFSPEEIKCDMKIFPIREIALEIVPVGEPAQGYYVSELTCSPASVRIAADDSVFSLVRKLAVSCNVGGASGDVAMLIDLQEYLGKLGYDDVVIADGNRMIAVSIGIMTKEERTITLDGTDIGAVNVGEGLVCSLHGLWGATIRISGRSDIVSSVTAGDFGLYVDMAGCGEGTYTRKLYSTYEGDLEMELGTVTVKLTGRE